MRIEIANGGRTFHTLTMASAGAIRAAVALLVVTLGAACHSAGESAPTPPTEQVPSQPRPSSKDPTARKESGAGGGVAISYPARGSRSWLISAGERSARHQGGQRLRYRVAVEKSIQGLTPDDFAAEVTATLNDPRGWTADGTVSLVRVGKGQPYDFTIYLATPETRDVLCDYGPDGYTSCRNGDRVVINVARWATGAKKSGASLSNYRQYVINHEVGHRLGHGHELCPGPGEPAPVMQQQTLGLHGCRPNAWPYLDGERYAGKPGQYQDPVPPPSRGSGA